MAQGIGDNFQQMTKYARGRIPGGPLEWSRMPRPFKDYPDAPKIKLQDPATSEGDGVWDVMKKRRSERDYDKQPVAEADLSQLLWAAQGVTAEREGYKFRTAPSAGALYPVETYVVVNNIEGVEQGVYHYDPREHQLDQLETGDFRVRVAQAALDQEIAYYANAVFVWTAVFGRSKWKYQQRAYRYVYLDAGHIAQNVALAAVAIGLGSCQIAAIYDDEANALLGVDGKQESAIYMTVVGRPVG